MIYNAGTNNLEISELTFDIDSTNGEVILILPIVADYVGSGTGVFNKTVTYTWTDIAIVKNNVVFKGTDVKNRGSSIGIGEGVFIVTITGTYDSPSTYCVTTILRT